MGFCSFRHKIPAENYPGNVKSRHTSMAFAIDDNVGLTKYYPQGPKRATENTYPGEYIVEEVVGVKAIKPFRYFQQLERG